VLTLITYPFGKDWNNARISCSFKTCLPRACMPLPPRSLRRTWDDYPRGDGQFTLQSRAGHGHWALRWLFRCRQASLFAGLFHRTAVTTATPAATRWYLLPDPFHFPFTWALSRCCVLAFPCCLVGFPTLLRSLCALLACILTADMPYFLFCAGLRRMSLHFVLFL